MNEKSPKSAFATLIIGLPLSAIIIVPSVKSLPFGSFSIIYHLIMLAALVSPFLIIYFVFRKTPSNISPITFGVLFSLTHAYLVYVTYAYPAQEFGYVGLIFAPVLEAVVALPVALLVIFIMRKLCPN